MATLAFTTSRNHPICNSSGGISLCQRFHFTAGTFEPG